MPDPYFTDPRYNNSRWGDPYDASSGGIWSWVAGIVVVAIIAFFVMVGGERINQNTASNTLAPLGTRSPNLAVTPQGTTGMGSPQQFPLQPRPATSGNQWRSARR